MGAAFWTGFWLVSGSCLVMFTLPGTLTLLFVSLGGVLSRLRVPVPASLPAQQQRQALRIAIVVPAHNEEALVQRCLASLLTCEQVNKEGIIVIADNCTDATAERARAYGARILERHDERQRGKGYALAFAFTRLLTEQWDAYAVIDADTVVESNFLAECSRLLAAGADAMQARHLVRNATDSLRTRLMRVALLAFNGLRPRGRDYWGCSAGIFGNGFVLTKATLSAVPYDAHSVVEDLEYHLRLVRAGRRVRFTDATTVWADMPTGGAGVTTQRARWEGGRLRVAREMALPLLRESLTGRPRLLEPLCDLLLPPLAFHVALLLTSLAIPIVAVRLYAVAGLIIVAAHVLIALVVDGGNWKDIAALATAPFYLLWKLTMIPTLIRAARPEAAWVRTVRAATCAATSTSFSLLKTLSSEKTETSQAMAHETLDASLVIVSFNTRELLRECLGTVQREVSAVSSEVFVVDNASADGSAEMVAKSFPWARLIRSPVNLGFAAANNLAFPVARGRYVILLNSDAFPRPGALARAVAHMDAHPQVGLAGARLVGRDDPWQPSARMFPSLLNAFLLLSGLSAQFPRSRFFGRADRTWADPLQSAAVDWVPGAFSIIRRSILEQVGYFDERFFLYYEEVDLCRRIRAAGYAVWYWPDVVVVHLGGESAKTVTRLTLAAVGSQLTLWRMRSALLYYHKHHGSFGAWLAKQQEISWHGLRSLHNIWRMDSQRRAKAEESAARITLMRQAWQDTVGGRICPARPW